MTVLLGGRFTTVPKVEFEENNFLLANLGWPVNISHSEKQNKYIKGSGFWENRGFRVRCGLLLFVKKLKLVELTLNFKY
jgi:hypothetical protein